MSNDKTKTFSGVTPEQFQCIKEKGASNKPPAIYNPADAPKGTVTIKTLVGTIELSFDYDQGGSTLTYVIIKKPGLVPIGRLWSGFQDTVDSCK